MMIKLVLTGVWVCVITLASVYFSVRVATAPAPDADAAKNKLEFVQGEPITVPVIVNGLVNGYFVGKVSFMMDKEQVGKSIVPLPVMTTDELFTLLVGNSMIDISNVSSFDVAAFRAAVKKDMNERLGGNYIADVMVEQLDYLARADLKSTSAAESRKLAKPVAIVVPTPAAAVSSGH